MWFSVLFECGGARRYEVRAVAQWGTRERKQESRAGGPRRLPRVPRPIGRSASYRSACGADPAPSQSPIGAAPGRGRRCRARRRPARARRARAPSTSSAARSIAAPRPDWPSPPIVTRAAWGANEGIRRGGQEYDTVVEKIVIHHTATPSNPADPAAALRGVYTHAVSSGGYIDLQYNWMIDHNGRIYEGRWASDYPAGVAHTGEANGANVRGGHAEAHNSRTIGVCFLGTYTNSLAARRRDRSARATPRVEVRAVGHRPARQRRVQQRDRRDLRAVEHHVAPRDEDAIATEPTCPGDPLISLLPQIRERVAAALARRLDRLLDRIGRGSPVRVRSGSRPRRHAPRSAFRLGSSASPATRRGRVTGSSRATAASSPSVRPRSFGSTGGIRLNRPMIGMAGVPDGQRLLAGRERRRRLLASASAQFYGSTGALRLNSPVIGMCPTPGGGGYWLYARDGGIFSLRQREVLRLDRRHPPEPADRRDGGAAAGRRLLARRRRRRRVRVRRRAVPRFDWRDAARTRR